MLFLLLIFLAGMISFLSPCILPMISVYFSLITGLSLDNVDTFRGDLKVRRGIIINTLAFITAFIIVFTLFGALAGTLGNHLKIEMTYLNVVGGLFIILLALRQLGLIRFPMVQFISIRADTGKFTRKFNSQSLTAFFVGIFFALICSHCIGPTLYSLLILAGSNSSVGFGILVMFVFSLGLSVPYLGLAIFINKFLDVIKKAAKYQRIIKISAGIILLLFGLLMVTNKITYLFKFFQDIIPYELPIGM